LDMPASSEWTRKTLGWEPNGCGLIEDLKNMKYWSIPVPEPSPRQKTRRADE